MDTFTRSKITDEILRKSAVGVWAIEYDLNSCPRMFGNDILYQMLGIDDANCSPEQVYKIWKAGIAPDSLKLLHATMQSMSEGDYAKVDYKWTNDSDKSYYIRSTGCRNDEYKEFVRIEGCYMDITDQIELQEKANRREVELSLVREMEITYTGIAQALCRAYECVYYVNIVSGHYKEYSSNGDYQTLQFQNEGDDFFADFTENARSMVHKDDFQHVVNFFADRKLLKEELNDKNSLTLSYRLMIKGNPKHYSLRIVPLSQDDVIHCIIAVRNIEADIQRNHKYESQLREANRLATCDALTGSVNRLGYEQEEAEMNRKIEDGTLKDFAILVFDVNNLKFTNDTIGHDMGDKLIIKTSQMIGEVFKNQNIYRIGGDEFVVILRGEDYENRSTKLAEFFELSRCNISTRNPVVAVGMSEYDSERDNTVADVFIRADRDMYQTKNVLKTIGALQKKVDAKDS